MSSINYPDPIPASEVAGEVLKRVSSLLHSQTVTSKTFTRSTPEGEVELVETLIGELTPEEKYPHVVVSTFGVGGVPTNGSITLTGGEEDKTLNYHAEFFMVADSVDTANVFAEELAQIVYLVTDTKQPLIPGTIISRTEDEKTKFYLFSERPGGILGGHMQSPVVSDEFAVCFVAVTPVYPSEFEMLQNGSVNVEELGNFLSSLGIEAYSLDRPEYFPGAIELLSSDFEIETTDTDTSTDTDTGSDTGTSSETDADPNSDKDK